jgi:uncharacterized repeat protein (TIGR01451 family)
VVPTVAITSYNGLNFGQTADIQANTIGGASTPPDPQGAVGPYSYVEAVNLSFAIFAPQTSGINPTTDAIDDFFNYQGNLPDSNPNDLTGNSFSDPSAVFDEQTQRFIISCMEVDPGPQFGSDFTGNNSSVYDFAVSRSSDPLTLTSADWNFYQVNTSEANEFSDYPGNIGYNSSALVVTLNEINVATQNTDHVLINAISMSDLAKGVAQAGLHIYQDDFQAASLRPTVMHDSTSATDPMWLVQEHPGTGGLGDGQHIDVVRMDNVLSSSPAFTTTTLAVHPYSDISLTPPLQPGGSVVTPALDSRILKAAERSNLLVASHSVSVSKTEDDAQWYAIDLSSSKPVLKQQGDVSGGNNAYVTYPAIDINPAGDMGMVYMQSGTDTSTDFLSIYVTGRKSSDPSGTMRAPVLAQAGQQVYEDFGPSLGSDQRAGDLSGINVDALGNFWAVSEFADNEPLPAPNAPAADWGTHIVDFTLAPVADLTVAASGPTAVTAGGTATYTITLTNNGPDAAQSVVLSDTLPAGAGNPSIAPVSNPDGFSFTLANGVFTSGPVTVANGDQDVFNITVSVPSLPKGAVFDDSASVASTTIDPNPYDDAATVIGSTGQVITISTNYNAVNYGQTATLLGGVGPTPPDNQGAVGPNSFVEAVNDEVAIYNPRTSATNPTVDSLDDFFAVQGKLPDPNPNDPYGNFITDPFVIFDELTQRFVVGAEEVDPGPQFTAQSTGNNSSVLDLAVSKSSNPLALKTSDWNFYQVNTSEANEFSDYPGNAGYNGGALVVTLNEFNTANPDNPDHVLVNAVNLNDLANGVPQASLRFYQSDFKGESLRPATMHNSTSANDPMWFVEEHLGADGYPDNQRIDVVRMDNVLSSTPTFSTTTLAVTPYSQIVPPMQPDGSTVTPYLDSRIMKVAEQGATLVAVQAVSNAAGNQDLVQWYRIDVSSTPVLRDQGDVGSGPNTYLYFPGIDINPVGNIGMSYIQSGTDNANDFMSMYVTGRTPSDPGGTMEAPYLAQAGQQVYEDFGPAFAVTQRAGDLSGINVDAAGNFWAINEFADDESLPTTPDNPVADPNAPGADWATNVVSFALPVNTRTWTGLSTTSSKWSDPANWAGHVVPGSGDNLLFGPGASQLSNTDDLAAGTIFSSIAFSSGGYTLSGNAVTLSGNLDGSTATGNNVLNLNVTLANGAGVLMGPSNTDLTLGGTINNGGAIFTVGGGAGRVDFTGAIAGSGGLTVNAGGTVALSGPADTYLGATTVAAGTLLLDKASGNAVPGALTVPGGTVRLLAGNQIADAAAVAISVSGLLDLNSHSDTVGSVTLSTGAITTAAGTLTLGGNLIDTGVSSISGNLALGSASRTLTVNASSTLTVSAVVSGSFAVTKAGSGTLVLTGADSYTGGTTLSGGTLTVGNNSALGAGTFTVIGGVLIATGAAVKLGNAVTLAGTLTVGGTLAVTLSGPVTLTGNRTIGIAAPTTISGVVGESGGSWQLSKNGSGALVLTGANTYSGGTALLAGPLTVGNNSALGSGTLTVTVGVLSATGAAVTLANAVTLGGNLTVGGTLALTFSGAVTLTGNRTLGIVAPTTISGVVGESGGSWTLTKTGAGALVLTGANTYSGGTALTAGTLTVGNNSALGTGTLTVTGGVLSATGAAVILANTVTLGGNLTVGGTVALAFSGAVTLTGNRTLTVSNTAPTTISGIVGESGGSWKLTKAGNGALVLTVANTYSGGTALTAGTLTVGNNSALGTGTFTVTGGALNATGAAVTLANAVTLSGNLTVSGSLAVTLSGAVTLTGNRTLGIVAPTTISGAVGESGGSWKLSKNGNGTLALAVANTYSGGTVLSGGTLTVGNNGALGTGTLTITLGALSATGAAVTLANAVTLGGNLTVNGSLAVTFSGAVTLTGNRTLGIVAPTTISGIVGETGGSWTLTKTGNGALVLSAANTYSGGTALTAGTITVGNNSALGTGTLTVTSGAIAAGSAPVTLANPLTLGGNFTVTGSQALTFTGTATLTLTRTITVTNTGSTTLAGNIGQSASGLGLTKAGTGKLILSGTNSYTGATTVTAGTLLVNGSQAGSAVSVNSGATLSGTGTVGAVTAVSGGVVAAGAGTGLPGTLTVTAITLPSGSSFNAALNGTTAGSGYAQLIASGTINLTGSTLNVSLGFTPAIGNSFTIIKNTGAGAIVGTFKGLAQNGTFTQNGMVFQISYTGGSGHDVVLTRTS